MARKLIWPLDDKERPWWRERLERWHELSGDDRLEVLKAWCDDQDGRQAKVDTIVKALGKILVFVATLVGGVFAKDCVGQYQLVRTGQTILPPPTGAPSIAPDFQKTAPRPTSQGGP